MNVLLANRWPIFIDRGQRPASDITQAARDAVKVLDKRKVDFEYRC